MIETLKSLAWTPRPAPPIGVAPWDRKRRWFRWYIVMPVLRAIWCFRDWRWRRRTGGRMEWLD